MKRDYYSEEIEKKRLLAPKISITLCYEEIRDILSMMEENTNTLISLVTLRKFEEAERKLRTK
jgi:hypothetical protein